MITAVILDLFGTLIDLPRDTDPYLQLCRRVDRIGRIRESLVVDAPTLGDFCDHLAVPHPPDLHQIEDDLNADVTNAELFADVVPTVEALRERGLLIAVISNLASPYKRSFQILGLGPLTDVTVFSCDVGLAKPDPQIYRLALTELGVVPEQALMIGDSPRSDVEGPRKAGLQSALLLRGASPESGSLRSLTEVLQLLE